LNLYSFKTFEQKKQNGLRFLKYQAQTSPYPLGMEISHAKATFLIQQEKYLDFVAGVSTCSLIIKIKR
jgi:hypothetical protein